jgi:hypothetical protein
MWVGGHLSIMTADKVSSVYDVHPLNFLSVEAEFLLTNPMWATGYIDNMNLDSGQCHYYVVHPSLSSQLRRNFHLHIQCEQLSI